LSQADVADAPATRDRVKVVYILAWGRSGSTILDNVLGEVDGFFSAGEIRFLWVRGVTKGWRCGCGRPVVECEVWASVLSELSAGGADLEAEAKAVERLQNTVARVRHSGRLLKPSQELADDPEVARYASLLSRLFRSTAATTGARVIVDSSKRPSDAAMLTHVPGVDLYVVHLVRDPRAVAHSWSKKNYRVGRHGVVKSKLSWVSWNLAGEAVRRRLRKRALLVRYEDFAQDPRKVIRDIVRLAGEDPAAAPALDGNRVDLSPNHTVSGNPSRFRTGAIEVRPDDRWRHELSAPRWWAATLLALPLLGRYGYPLRRGRRASSSAPQPPPPTPVDLGPSQRTRPPSR
jgi:hypothetical protein